MYGWIWRYLPGPAWLRVIILALFFLALVVICFKWLFPVISPLLPFNEQTVGDQ